MESLKTVLNNPYLSVVVRLVLGLIFIIASVDKIADAGSFAKSIQNYDIMPIAVINIVALVLPWLELICGLFLVFGVRLRASSALIAGMLVVFIVAIFIAAEIKGLDIGCGCFSQSGEGTKVGWNKIVENIGLLCLAAQIFFFPNARFALGGAAEQA